MSVEQRFGVDLVKATGAFMVVVLHVSASGFYQFDENWFAYNLYDSMVRVAVPLFLMVTGVLLLDRQQTLTAFFRRRAARILPPLVFWSLIYTLVRQGEQFDAASFLAKLFVGPAEYHLWYLYALLGVYAFVPFLRVFYIHSSLSERSFFLLAWALVNGFWPPFVTLSGVQHDLVGTYALHSFLGFSAYLLLGATLGTLAVARFRFVGLIVFLASGLGVAVLTYLRALQTGQPGELFYGYLSPLVLAGAVGFFCFAMSIENSEGRFSRLVRTLSDRSMGIYCVHVLFVGLAFKTFGFPLFGANPWLTLPAVSMGVFVLSALTAWALGHIPGLRRVV